MNRASQVSLATIIHVLPDIVIADTVPTKSDLFGASSNALVQITGNPVIDFSRLKWHIAGPHYAAANQSTDGVLNAVQGVYLWAIGGWERLLSLAWFVSTNSLLRRDIPIKLVRNPSGMIRTRDVPEALALSRPFVIEELQFYDTFWNLFITPGLVRVVGEQLAETLPDSEPCRGLLEPMQKFLPSGPVGEWTEYCQLDKMILSCVHRYCGCSVAKVVSELCADIDFSGSMILRRIHSMLDADLLCVRGVRLPHFFANVVCVSDFVATGLDERTVSRPRILHVPLELGALTAA